MTHADAGMAHGKDEKAGGRFLEDSDEMLMLRTGRGDIDAFHRLVERHLERLVSFAARVLNNYANAEDVAQETFLRVWTNAARWEPSGRLSPWLHRVALHLCLDMLGRARDVPLENTVEPSDPGPSPLARTQAREIGLHVNAALQKLTMQQRIAITLCHYQGLRNIEAADVMGMSVEALESLLARGRRTLRAHLRDVAPDLIGEE